MNAYDEQFESYFISPEEYEEFQLALPDEKLHNLLIRSLEQDIDFWNQSPWRLKQVDAENLKFYLGDQWEATARHAAPPSNAEIDNRLFTGIRAILAYSAGRLAVPEITPSGSGEMKEQAARNLSRVLYQHSKDEGVEPKVRAAILNLLLRKRAFLKLRFDKYEGIDGDIVTEVVDPSDIVLDRTAKFGKDPNKIYHRIRCSLDELCSRFPEKADEIYKAFSVKKGVYTQLSRLVTYYECWFTYLDKDHYPRQAICSFLHDPADLVLDKTPNPNWIYTGDDRQDRMANLTSRPPKPFIGFNYLNSGLSAVDETSLFDQAKPEQIRLNKRQKQWQDNIDYVNGRWVGDSNAMSQEVANNLIRKGPKTVALIDAEKAGGDVKKAFANVAASALPQEVYLSIQDARNEIDTLLGTPAIFRGADPTKKGTLGRDMMVNQQAGNLQDDLVKVVYTGMENYYMLKAQMMRTYFTEDHTFQVKTPAGKHDFITLSGETIDTGVKIGVQVDSTLPIEKENIRQIATELLKANKIDYLTAMEDMGLPNPEIRAERFMKSLNDPIGYLQSIEQGVENNEAEMDIQSLIANKVPEESEAYTEEYLNYFNTFITTQRFRRIQAENPEAAKRIIAFLMMVQEEAVQTANLRGSIIDTAGMIPTPGPNTGGAPQTGTNSAQAGPTPPGGTNPGNPGSSPGNDANKGQGDQAGGKKTATPTMGSMKKQVSQQGEEQTGQPLPL